MVRMFRRLDVVEEAAINHSLPRRRNRRDEVGGLRRIRPRAQFEPSTGPEFLQFRDGAGRLAFEKGGLIQERVTDAAVSPIDEGEPMPVAAQVAGVEISVRQRIGKAA